MNGRLINESDEAQDFKDFKIYFGTSLIQATTTKKLLI